MNNVSKKSIIVTGASSGIGYSVATCLAKKGYTVLATVRKSNDVEKINDLGLINLIPLFPFDLTKPDQIESLSESVKEKIRNDQLPGLYAIINIAGGGHIAPIELMNIADYREELEKRLVGPVILLQKLLPLLRQTKGRVLWIATPGLFPVTYVADIHAPDFAVNCLARTLNLELYPYGIKNILIRCGGINTTSPERTENELAERLVSWPKDKSAIYEKRLTKSLQNMKKFNTKRTDPEKVAELIAKALFIKNPKVRYHIGHLSGLGGFVEKLPQSWVDFVMEKRENH
jgi:NAD(P)-dependent dehydrogenase (short-subunit alcohol dehydrogenase family)